MCRKPTVDDSRRWLIPVVLVVVLVLGLPWASSTEDSGIPAVVFPTAPVIDGVLDDEVWETAATVEGFVQFVPHLPDQMGIFFHDFDGIPGETR